jgi:uncharacterized protein (TIGR03083 family)
MIPSETIDKLEATWTSISEFCATLTEAQWKTPTQLPNWSVQDNLAHLIAFESDFHGLPRPEHTAPDKSHVKNELGDSNEDDVDYWRSFTGAEVLAEWNKISSARLETMRTADEAYFAREVMSPAGPGTVADFLHIRVLDCWTHEQDMRRTLGLLGHQSGPSAEHTIDRLIRTVPMVIGKRAGTPEGECVVICITGHVQRVVATTIVEGRGKVSNEVPSTTRCDISMDSDTFLQLATGRATNEELADHITIAGDADHANRVLTQFTMMI